MDQTAPLREWIVLSFAGNRRSAGVQFLRSAEADFHRPRFPLRVGHAIFFINSIFSSSSSSFSSVLSAARLFGVFLTVGKGSDRRLWLQLEVFRGCSAAGVSP